MQPIDAAPLDAAPTMDAGDDNEVLLYQSARTRVVRRRSTDGADAVVVKELRGPDASRRLRHELAMLRRLAGVEGVPRLAVDGSVEGAIALVDTGGESLAQSTKRATLDLPAVIDLAHSVAGIVAAMHDHGVIHRDLNPANVVVVGGSRPMLIDFDLATTFAVDRPAFTHASEITGTLPYLAPEQTGRTGWTADHRADLYALGATFYELTTGRPPFVHADALETIRDHLTVAPVPPAERDGAVPAAWSAIVMRLLEKEPDRRYQSAVGLVHDLSRLRERLATGRQAPFTLGERDFPLRLTAAARPVGRQEEIATLDAAFADAVRDRGVSVLVTGPPGVGKTTLIDELRPTVTAYKGWFVAGKFDEHRRDQDADAVWQALRALARLLLAEPEPELLAWRRQFTSALGPNANVIAAALPELAAMLGVELAPIGATAADDAEARLVRAAVDLMTAVASPDRPLVFVVDDLQWAGDTALRVIDAVLTERPRGMLLVGAYRDTEVDAVHPLSARFARWERLGVLPRAVVLGNLPPTDLRTLLADMLRLRPDEARGLAEAVAARTDGNPFDTVELVNALRRDGVLVPTQRGWRWDVTAIRRHVGRGDVLDILAARIAQLPQRSQALVWALTCLGGQVQLAVLEVASGLSAAVLDECLEPTLEDGLLVLEAGGRPSVRFRHDRVRQAAQASLESTAQRELHLSLARRLNDRPEFHVLAAEQYLAAVDILDDPAERHRAAGVLRTAATSARVTNPALAEQFLAAATGMLREDTPPTGPGAAQLAEMEKEHHAVLCGLGRLEEADEVFVAIERRDPSPLERTGPVCVRIGSLRARNRVPEALALGLNLLARLGLAVPSEDRLREEIGRGCEALRQWVQAGGQADDVRRPEARDPVVLACADVISEILPVAYFAGQPIFAWLVTEAQRMWAEHGPSPAMVGPLAHAAFMTIALQQDYRTGYEAVQRVVAVSEARGYEPQTSHARFLFSLSSGQWFGPVVDNVDQIRQAREGLQYHGSPAVCFTYYSSVPQLMDCAPTLERFAAEAEAALAMAARVGDAHSAAAYLGYRQLARALRGETAEPGSLSDPSVDISDHLATLGANPTAAANVHTTCAVAAAVFGASGLAEHAAAAMALLPFINATYLTATVHLMQSLALIEQARDTAPGERAGILAALAECRAWIARRTEDAPGNFGYMVRLIDAEFQSIEGDAWDAAREFDVAVREVARQQRPWHQALILERSGRFHLASGLEHVGRSLLAQARRHYDDWGASGKVAELDRAHPYLRSTVRPRHTSIGLNTSTSLSGSTIDILGVLEASRALSSATSPDRLRQRVTEVLGAMTGATTVLLLLWDDAVGDWVLPPDGDEDGDMLPVSEAAVQGRVPLSVVRYVQRTREPLLVEDATRDERFAKDPYFDGVDGCSLLVVPTLSRGVPQALLLLENRLSRGAFSDERLDSVKLVAGQLAVSIENAAVYASLEQKVNQRTEALARVNQRLEQLNQTDPLTGLANRRRLEDVLAAEWGRSVSTGSPIGVVMIDIDYFKQYNDHLGHVAGDECLRKIADALADGARATDVVARYGGEEFAIVLANADLETTRRVSERVRAAVARLREPHPTSPVGSVTVSIGIAAATPSTATTAGDLVNMADMGLYEAKRSGRDRIAEGPAPAG